MAWGAAIGAGIQAATQIASHFLNKGDSNAGMAEAKSWEREKALAGPSWLVEGARRAGIHPLVAFGSNFMSGFGSPVTSGGGGSSTGSAILDALGGLSGGLGEAYEQDQDRLERESQRDDIRFQQILDNQYRMSEQDKQDRRDRLNERYVEQQILESRSRTMAELARARAIGGMGSGSPASRADEVITPFANVLPLPKSTDAQRMSDEFGDMVGEAYGFMRWLESQLTDPRTGEGVARKWMREQGLLKKYPHGSN